MIEERDSRPAVPFFQALWQDLQGKIGGHVARFYTTYIENDAKLFSNPLDRVNNSGCVADYWHLAALGCDFNRSMQHIH